MHLDKWPSSLGAGPQKINNFESQYSRHYWGWALGKRGGWISWFLNCTFTTLEPGANVSMEAGPRGIWKWVPRWCRFCGDTHPPSPGAAPPGRGALPAEPQLDPALNDQPSCRIPGGLGCQVLWKHVLFWLSQKKHPLPFPRPWAWGNFLKNPK